MVEPIHESRKRLVAEMIQRRDRRDWTQLPADFELSSVRAAFADVKPYIEKKAIGARVKASIAQTFTELRTALQL